MLPCLMSNLTSHSIEVTSGDGETIKEAIEALHERNPLVEGVYGGQGIATSGPRYVEGGGVIVLKDQNVFELGPSLKLPPRTRLLVCNTEIRSMEANPAIEAVSGGIFSRNNIEVIGIGGARLNGNGVGTIGAYLPLAQYFRLDDLVIDNFVEDGVVFEQAQHSSSFRGVRSFGNGGWGVRLSNHAPTAATFGNNDIHADSVFAQYNAKGGVLIESSANTTWTDLRTQFHDTVGFRIQPKNGGVYSTTLTGGHREGNRHHFEVLNGTSRPANTTIRGGATIPDDGQGTGSGTISIPVERFLVNEGWNTVLDCDGSFNGPGVFALHPTTGGGLSNAMCEQNSQQGSLHIRDRMTHRAGPNRVPYCCREDGTNYPEGTAPNATFALSAIGRSDAGAPFPSGAYFGPNQPNE